MALIICPECGREISDKAASCPGCGCPVQSEPVDSRTDLERLVDEIWQRNPNKKVNAIKELREATGMNLKPAKDIMDKKYQGLDASNTIVNSVNTQARYEENKLKMKETASGLRNSLNTLANITRKDTTARCPKCKSASISYDTKKLSVGRGVVGYGLAGPVGAVMGGLSSKKGYAVCLNCGKRWKI